MNKNYLKLQSFSFFSKFYIFIDTTDVIIKNNLCEIALERYNKQLKKDNNIGESDIAKEEKKFHRSGTFGSTIKKLLMRN